MITIYHHSRCTVSREALTLLDQLCARENLLLEILDYHQLLLTAPILSDLQKKLGLPMREMIRYHDPKYIRLKLSKADDAGLFQAIVKHPRLLQRPIVIYQNRAIIAYPAELIEPWFYQSRTQ
ncbi:ArsC/Spx/MgsR family protein [Glaciimonas immobilis]|uniref:Arsenate reductase n=1 Tax=Glaciimonas immobilis TaxID=728004 RepID=A0A840RX08_9BURK|nr:ArsC/Spx/MgsR family protein [Glaciimonas immobilis]KAF3995960.1 arsenate reductase (glutaredoxin) [Glaciimonas immobilis]MBB5202425.1 arsenate reductase [Glaciimonas immobilis]